MNDAMPIDYKVSPILPTAEQLTFRNKHASELVGKTILFNWAGVGWCKGTIHSTNIDGRKKINGKAANFLVTYEVDGPTRLPTTSSSRTMARSATVMVIVCLAAGCPVSRASGSCLCPVQHPAP